MGTYQHIRIFCNTLLTALVLQLGAVPFVAATEVYTWVDEQGVTHFSQTPPQTDGAHVEVLKLDTQGISDASAEVDNILKVANELEASRLARQKAALERDLAEQKLDIERQRLEQALIPPASPVYNYAIPFRHKKKHPHRHAHHPGKRPRDCAPHCDDAPQSQRGPRRVDHGTTHLKPYKSLR